MLVVGFRALAPKVGVEFSDSDEFLSMGACLRGAFSDGSDRLLANDTWRISCTILEPDDPCESNHPFLGFSDRPLALAFSGFLERRDVSRVVKQALIVEGAHAPPSYPTVGAHLLHP